MATHLAYGCGYVCAPLALVLYPVYLWSVQFLKKLKLITTDCYSSVYLYTYH